MCVITKHCLTKAEKKICSNALSRGLYFEMMDKSGSRYCFHSLDSTRREVMGVTANVPEGKPSWDFYCRGPVSVTLNKQQYSGCLAEVYSLILICVFLEKRCQKQTAKQLQT